VLHVGRFVACFGLLQGIWCSSAFAADPLNSNNRPNAENRPITQVPDARDAADDDVPHTDFNLVPVVGGSTDLGFGGGYFAGIARNQRGYDPFLWNIDSSALITFKYTASGGLMSYGFVGTEVEVRNGARSNNEGLRCSSRLLKNHLDGKG